MFEHEQAFSLKIKARFSQNQSQKKSEKNDTEEEQCINQEETDEDQRKPKKITNFPENLVATSQMVAL